MVVGAFISLQFGWYYEGDQTFWKDMQVPFRPGPEYVWRPNPERPTSADWQFDGHDADGGEWVLAEAEQGQQ